MTDTYDNYKSNIFPKLFDDKHDDHQSFKQHKIYLNQHFKGIDKKVIDTYNTCQDNSISYLVLRNSYGNWNLYNLNLLASILKLPNNNHKIGQIKFDHYKNNLHVYNYNWSIKLLNHYFDNLHPFNFIEYNDEGKVKKTPVGTGKIFYKELSNNLIESTFQFLEVRTITHNNKHILINLNKLLDCPEGNIVFTSTPVTNIPQFKEDMPDPSKEETDATFSFKVPTHKEVLTVLSEVLYKSTISQSDVKVNLLHLINMIMFIIIIIMIITRIIN